MLSVSRYVKQLRGSSEHEANLSSRLACGDGRSPSIVRDHTNMIDVRIGDARVLIKEIRDKSIDCVMTSPPFWGLRDYKTEPIIFDGLLECEHDWSLYSRPNGGGRPTESAQVGATKGDVQRIYGYKANFCLKCGAWRGQLGLEPTPELFIKHLVDFFDDVKSKLKDEGNCFVNLGDTYFGSGCGTNDYRTPLSISLSRPELYDAPRPQNEKKHPDLKPKSLCMIPQRFAWGMIERGWILRNEIIWAKPNHMPESVTDRLTKAHEVVYHFVKSSKTLLWRHKNTREWSWTEPNPDYIWVNPETKETLKVAVEGWKRINLWVGFDYYYNLDAIRESHKDLEDNIRRRVKGPEYDNKTKITSWQREKHSSSQSRTTKGLHENRWNQYFNTNGKNPGDVWEISLQPYNEAHFAVFPLELVRRPILAGCPPNSWVLDPFAGSGTVGEFCRLNDRNAILFELNPDYKLLIEERALLKVPELSTYL